MARIWTLCEAWSRRTEVVRPITPIPMTRMGDFSEPWEGMAKVVIVNVCSKSRATERATIGGRSENWDTLRT